MNSLLKRQFSENKQFLKFGLVGLSNTLISYLTYAVLVYFTVHYQIANIVAFIISSLSGFLLNRSWVFKAKHSAATMQLVKYYIIYGSSLIISLALSCFWIEMLGINKYLPPILNLCITVPYNYIFNKIWAFREQRIENELTSFSKKNAME
jgi:putative flippase GtrA